MDSHTQGVVPMLSYADGPAAMDWLSKAFGFEERERWLDESGVLSHGEMSTGDGLIMLATPTRRTTKARYCIDPTATGCGGWSLPVGDRRSPRLRRRCRCSFRACQETAGASLLSEVESGPEGSRLYRVEDVEGHRWMFMQRGN